MEMIDNYKNGFEGKVLSPMTSILSICSGNSGKTDRQSRDNLIKSLSLLQNHIHYCSTHLQSIFSSYALDAGHTHSWSVACCFHWRGQMGWAHLQTWSGGWIPHKLETI